MSGFAIKLIVVENSFKTPPRFLGIGSSWCGYVKHQIRSSPNRSMEHYYSGLINMRCYNEPVDFHRAYLFIDEKTDSVALTFLLFDCRKIPSASIALFGTHIIGGFFDQARI